MSPGSREAEERFQFRTSVTVGRFPEYPDDRDLGRYQEADRNDARADPGADEQMPAFLDHVANRVAVAVA